MFKRKLKPIKKHEIRDLTGIPQHHQFNRAVKCIDCGKSFVMDVFGGWSIEWDFKIDESFKWNVDKDDFDKAVKHKYSLSQMEWFMIDEHPCECHEQLYYVIFASRHYILEQEGELKLVKSEDEATRYTYNEAKKMAKRTFGKMIRVPTEMSKDRMPKAIESTESA